jgi:hypothetical protein
MKRCACSTVADVLKRRGPSRFDLIHTMVVPLQVKAPHLPNNIFHSRMQHSTLRPNYKVFLLYMSYEFPPEDSDPASRPSPLQGPMKDAKEMKFALIGGA